jgi:hypothetical protein
MEAFSALRRKALERRDSQIARIRDEYADSLRRIAELEQDLLGRDKPDHRSVASCVNNVLPTDRPFNIMDVMHALQASDPGRVWLHRTVSGHITRLREHGIIRRLTRAKQHQQAQYVRVGVEVEPTPFEDMSLDEVMRSILGQGEPMRITDVAVAALERGYRTSMTPKRIRGAIGVQLRKGPYEQLAGGKWIVA